jgi:Co/Zn/Cd efflux system component
MSLTTVEFLLGPLPPIIALLVVSLIGATVAIRRYGSQPTASRLLILGFCALLVNAIGSYVLRIYSYQSFDKSHDASVYGLRVAELYALLHSINLAGVILIVAAVFANRASVRDVAK